MPVPFWGVVSGGKYDFTAKWWEPARMQSVGDHFAGRILFAQVGERGHHRPPLRWVLDFRGGESAAVRPVGGAVPPAFDAGLSTHVPRCLEMITAEEVIQCVERCFDGGVVEYLTAGEIMRAGEAVDLAGSRCFDLQ